MDGILFDLDGVIYVGDHLLPGAREALEQVRSRGIPHAFLTNTTSRSRDDLVSKLEGFGIAVRRDQLLTPAVAAARWLSQHRPGEAALFVPSATRADFDGLPLTGGGATQAGAVVVGDLGEGWDFAALNHAFRLLMACEDAAFIALGMTRFWRAEDGLRLDTGPFVAALQYATGRDALVLGKPAAGFFRAALELIGCGADAALMVGDDIRGDIGGAGDCGIDGVLVRTGKFQAGDLGAGITPAAVLDSVADLPAWLDRRERGA